jgi:hypothetical protein
MAGVVLALSGCASGQIAQTAEQVAPIDGGNGNAGELGVRDVRLAPADGLGYDAGADVPVRLWLSNTAITPDTLTGVTSPVADEVVITGNADVQGQTRREILDDTDTTIVLKGLKEELRYGISVPMTFTFAAAGSITLKVPIEIPGERTSEARETINILPGEHGNIWFSESEGSGEGAGEGH